jgi:sodium/proline symporter
MLLSFSLCLLLFLAIGLLSVRKKRDTKQDYYVASNSVAPWLVGLSAVATNNSGYMFIGVIGYTYYQGLYAILLMLAWLLGDFLASMFVHKKFQEISSRQTESSYLSVITFWNQFNNQSFRYLVAIIALVFLLSYAGAQLIAGAKAIQILMNWQLWHGILLGSLIVLSYCLAGGIRASIWTDAAQSFVMFIAMLVMLYVVLQSMGGITEVYSNLLIIDNYLVLSDFQWTHLLWFFLAWMIAGFSVVAQPHIMIRFMSLNNPQHFFQMRCWYYLWFVIFYMMATGVGLLARLYFASDTGFDSETALPRMAQELLPPILTGLILAGIFAATISTADSLILSCSSFLSQELLPQFFTAKKSYRYSTAICVVVAVIWSLTSEESVFALVVMSWGMLAATFVPLIFSALIRFRISWIMATGMVILNVCLTFALWINGAIENSFEAAPAILLSCGCLLLLKLFGRGAHKRFIPVDD